MAVVVARTPGIRFEAQAPPGADTLPRMDVAASVGFAASGPLHTPVMVEDVGRFHDMFGRDLPLAWDGERGELAYAQLGPAVRCFFRNGGRRCWVVRVAHGIDPTLPKRKRVGARSNTFLIPGVLRRVPGRGLQAARARARSPGDELFVYVRHGRNSWALDRPSRPDAPSAGWLRVSEPALLAADRDFYLQRAAELDDSEPIRHLLPDNPRVRYLRTDPRRSVGWKRNRACAEARGDIVVHWDDDDWMAAWRLKYQVAALLDNPGVSACGLSRLTFWEPAAGHAWEYSYPAHAPHWVAGGTLAYRRAAWRDKPFFRCA